MQNWNTMIDLPCWGRRRIVPLFFVILIGLIVGACAEPKATTFTAVATATANGPTPTLPSMPSPTSSPVSIPAFAPPTLTATSTAAATSSPIPTPTHTPSPSPTPSSIPPTETPACAENQGSVQVGTFSSAIVGQEQPYRVYLPPCYESSDERYPVLYLLHGYPFDDGHWDDLGIDEAADAGIAAGTVPALIIAMPAADNEGTFTKTSGGAGSFEAVLLDEFLPFIEANYRAISTREGRAIGGMSRGGVWSLEIAFRNPDRFAAVGGHSAALNRNLAPPIYDPLYLSADPAIRSLRIYLDAGANDWVLPGMEDLHAALTAAGVTHEYNLFEGYHDDSYWAQHVGDYLTFYVAEW